MSEKKQKHIVLMFLSRLPKLKDAIKFKLINSGKSVDAIQTNETSIYQLAENSIKIDKIFAFATKKVTSEPIKDIDLTTLDFFKDRVKEYVASEDIIISSFDEDNAESSLDNIAAMAQLIITEINKMKEQQKDVKIVLHADMTGGLRNASMMMLGVMRLLEYSRCDIESVIYANYQGGDNDNTVVDSKDVYRFFDLVAGAKEFVNYGSVRELDSYFKNESKSKELAALLTAMTEFAGSIKLCQYGKFKNAVNGLKEGIETFESLTVEKMDANDKLFKTMLPIIKESYKKLLAATAANNDMEIIKWCVERDYLQQAMTLYTERVPEFIFEKGFLKFTDDVDKISKFKENYKDYFEGGGKGSEQYYAVVGYAQNPDDKVLKSIRRKFKDVFTAPFKKKFFDTDAAVKNIDDFIKNNSSDYKIEYDTGYYIEFLQMMDLCKKGKEQADKNALNYVISSPLFLNFIEKQHVEETDNLGIYFKDFCNFAGNNIAPDDLFKFFDINIGVVDAKLPRMAMERSITNKVFICGEDLKQDLLDSMDDFAWIRNIRNSSNHAREDEHYADVEVVEARIKSAVNRLMEMEKKVNG